MTQTGQKRRTIVGFSSPAATHQPGLYTHMFVEDISAGLMRLRLGPDREGRQIEVQGSDLGKAQSKAILNTLSAYPAHNLAEIIQSAIESIGTHLAWYGKAIYEVGGVGTRASLTSVAPFHLYRIPGGFIQLVSRKERKWLNEKRRYAFLPSSSAWTIQMPRQLGGVRSYQRLLRQLTAVSQVAPKFWIRELKAGKIATEFSVSDYNRSRDAYVARLTRQWGWNRRDSSGIDTTEFYYFFRSLHFRKAQAILRDHIIEEINRFMTRRSIEVRVVLKGYPSPSEIDNLIRDASDGTLNYAVAFQRAG